MDEYREAAAGQTRLAVGAQLKSARADQIKVPLGRTVQNRPSIQQRVQVIRSTRGELRVGFAEQIGQGRCDFIEAQCAVEMAQARGRVGDGLRDFRRLAGHIGERKRHHEPVAVAHGIKLLQRAEGKDAPERPVTRLTRGRVFEVKNASGEVRGRRTGGNDGAIGVLKLPRQADRNVGCHLRGGVEIIVAQHAKCVRDLKRPLPRDGVDGVGFFPGTVLQRAEDIQRGVATDQIGEVPELPDDGVARVIFGGAAEEQLQPHPVICERFELAGGPQGNEVGPGDFATAQSSRHRHRVGEAISGPGPARLGDETDRRVAGQNLQPILRDPRAVENSVIDPAHHGADL